ncbi:hypothetical protein PTSG_03577 [Salpingoeca rosetta]|uniref:MD-2-related lipid-recognition domain-containing protein n=1 Tax=Salpingoeca rosetta (strain ATCC 50818 / BSB-021) TaxID=946362 RepID=F2U603_SALR5|nr:uncharacterized protein PTSG_03577 [Salpingoeca rosetta]EGD82944.1 hypothetical protein PTSG_03577 [Salpingoeca rosetta]|eukprot:XP_004995308.1 hypothetical protein PTSG_03577 [Salpingoeca rosetta]
MNTAFAVVLAAMLVAVAAGVPVQKMHLHTDPTVMRLHKENPTSITLKSFSFSDCAPSSAPAHVSKLSISPDPIKLPGNITFSAAGSLSATVDAPIKAEVKLEKKVGVWIKIPCVDDIGSCSYDDLCKVLAKLIPVDPHGNCPAPLPSMGIPCRCPLTSFNFNVPTTTVSAPALPPSVPSWLSNGDYKATLEAKTNAGDVLFCANIELSLETK